MTETKQRRVQKQHQVLLRGLKWSHLAIHTSSSGSAPFVNMKTITQSTTIDHRLRSKPSDCASVYVLIHADADIILSLFIFGLIWLQFHKESAHSPKTFQQHYRSAAHIHTAASIQAHKGYRLAKKPGSQNLCVCTVYVQVSLAACHC